MSETAEMLNHTKTMQRIDAILGNPIRLTTSPEEYEAQRAELAELLAIRMSVFT